MTYYDRTADEHVDLALALVIEGIPFALVERTIPGTQTGLGGRTQVVCVTRVSEGETRLDFDERRETAPTLDVDMLDTDAAALRALFAAGTRAVAWVVADATAAANTFSPNTIAPFEDGGVIYIGAETIITDTTAGGPPEFTLVTRGAFGSTARVLSGTANDGDSIYLAPPFWRGRRASLYGYALDKDGGTTETLLGTFIVDEAPRHVGDKEWTLRCAGIAQEYFERVVGMGSRQVPVIGAATVDTTVEPWTWEFEVPEGAHKAFRLGSGLPAYVLVEGDDGATIAELLAVDTLNDKMKLNYSDPAFSTRRVLRIAPDGFMARQIAVVGGGNAQPLLFVLMSDEGQAATTYDRIPGRPAASSEDFGWRLGAGFTSAEVDTAAFLTITAIPNMALVIDGERKLTDLLREWCMLTGTVIVTTVDGKLKPITLAAQRLANARTLGPSDVIPEGPIGVTHDEEGVRAILKAMVGYSPVTRQTVDAVNLIDVELAKRYRRAPSTRDVELRSIAVFGTNPAGAVTGWRHPARHPIGAVVTMLNDLMRGDGALARRFVKITLTHEHLDLRIGDLVTLSATLPDAFTELPDMRGGTIEGASGRIVSRRPRYDDAAVDVEIELLDRLLHICPAAVISAVGVVGAGANGGTVVTLVTAGPELVSASPTAEFWVGAFVKIIDRSQGGGAGAPFFASILALPSGTTMELGSVPAVVPDGWTIEANNDYLTLDPDNSANGTSGTGYALVEAAMLAGDDGIAGTNPSATTEPRWR